MALASSFNVPIGLREASNRVNRPFLATPARIPAPRSVATFACRGNRTTAITSKRKKEALRRDVIKEADESDGMDPFEVLFGMLEEDLKNLDEELLGIDDEDEEDISPEELAKLEKELDAAIGESEELMQLLSVGDGDVIDVGSGGENEDDDEGVELELKDWQLKKLADASKAGHRRTNIKSLAAELGLDRDVVMDLLRIPPEVLLSMSTNSSGQNQKSPVVLEAEYEVLEDVPDSDQVSKIEAKSEVVVNASQTRRSSQKSRKNFPR